LKLAALYRALETAVAARADVAASRHDVVQSPGTWRLPRLASRPEDDRRPIVLVRAGIHGDERSGPVTFARHLDRIFDYAHRHGVAVLAYPLGNPSGYERGLRYNADHDAGVGGNNDFLRYELEDGSISDSVRPGESYRRHLWSSDPALGIELPAETRLMHELLRRDPLGRVVAGLDLHQDLLTPDVPAAAYHYAFGNLGVYRSIVERIAAVCPLLPATSIGAGFGTVIDEHGRVVGPPSTERAMTSDAHGFIVRHDGTLSDLLHRLGVRHSVTAETTGSTPMALAVEVNLAWVEGLVDLVAGR
jgi:hypothetical protein